MQPFMNSPASPDTIHWPAAAAPSCPVLRLLDGQTALVTGASSGIGRAIAVALGHAGANVVINFYGQPDNAFEVVEEVRRCGSHAIAVPADVSDPQQVRSMFERTVAEFGRLDILVNNAGIQLDAAFEDLTIQQWQRVMDVNLTGPFLCC